MTLAEGEHVLAAFGGVLDVDIEKASVVERDQGDDGGKRAARVETFVGRVAALFEGEDADVRILDLKKFEDALAHLGGVGFGKAHGLARDLRKFLQVVGDGAGRDVGPDGGAVGVFLGAAPVFGIGETFEEGLGAIAEEDDVAVYGLDLFELETGEDVDGSFQIVEGTGGFGLVELDAEDGFAAGFAGGTHDDIDVLEGTLEGVVLAAEAAFYFIERCAGEFDLIHIVGAEAIGGAEDGGGDVGTGVVPVHEGFADGIDGDGIRAAAHGVEVLDEVVAVGAEGAVPLAGVERVHDEPSGFGGEGEVADLLVDVVFVAADHPVVVGEVAELEFHGAGEGGVEMDLHFGEADVDVGFGDGAGDGKFVEADGPVDLEHVERDVIEGAEFDAGALGDGGDAADVHGVFGVAAHGAAFADLNARGFLFLDEFDEGFEHAGVGGEALIGVNGDDGVDLD